MSVLVMSLTLGLALAAPFVCVALWASKVHTRQVAHYECRLHALSRDCALKQEMLDRLASVQNAAWERECERFWAAKCRCESSDEGKALDGASSVSVNKQARGGGV